MKKSGARGNKGELVCRKKERWVGYKETWVGQKGRWESVKGRWVRDERPPVHLSSYLTGISVIYTALHTHTHTHSCLHTKREREREGGKGGRERERRVSFVIRMNSECLYLFKQTLT